MTDSEHAKPELKISAASFCRFSMLIFVVIKGPPLLIYLRIFYHGKTSVTSIENKVCFPP
jgi:hypothetical protein